MPIEITPAPPEAVILPPLPNDDPEMRDYYIGHLMDYWNDFRRVTRLRKKPRKAPEEPPRAVAPDLSSPDAPKRRRATRDQLRMRLGLVREWLVEGCSTARIIQSCQEHFGVRRRMAQIYLRRAKQRLANEAAREDYLAHLQISRLQHEALFDRIRAALDRSGGDPRLTNSLVRTAASLLKARDEKVATIVEHRAATSRDYSPDASAEKLRRQGTIEMPLEEWFERLNNLHYTWRTLWMKEQALPASEADRQAQGYPPSNGRGVEYEIVAQMRQRMREASQTVDPEILNELDLGDIDILAEPGAEQGTADERG